MTPKQRARDAAARGDIVAARAFAERACANHSSDPEAWFLLGAVCGGLSDFVEAERCCRRALELSPDNPAVLLNLGIAILRQGRAAEAIIPLRSAASLQANNAETHVQFGNALSLAENHDEAIACYETALRLKPDVAAVLCNLAAALRKSRRADAAAGRYQEALRFDPGLIEAWLGLADCYVESFRYDGATQALSAAVERFPHSYEARLRLAAVCEENGDVRAAANHFRTALSLRPGDVIARTGVARTLAFLGDDAGALEEFDRLLSEGHETVTVAVSFGHLARRFRRESEARSLIERVLARTDEGDARRRLLFALAKLEDDDNEFELAFDHVAEANRLRGLRLDRERWRRSIEETIEVYRPGAVGQFARSREPSNRPVFIVGMPRSGTSLIEQILASHPSVFGAGELNIITNLAESLSREAVGTYPIVARHLNEKTVDRLGKQYLSEISARDTRAERVTDKAPGNFRYLGLIAQILPKARVIHCVRNPLDTCLSCYFQDFSGAHEYAYDLGDLGFYYRGYERLMRHWHAAGILPILDVQYEELVAAPEAISRRMLEFLGLAWNARCLSAHSTRRVVATASHDQVLEPIHTRAVARWRSYERRIDPLRKALKDAEELFRST